MYRGFTDTGYLPYYFQGYGILSILLPGIWDTVFNILLLSGMLEILKNDGDICQFIRDTCPFTSRDMGLLRCRIDGTTESVMVAYTHKYAKV